MIVTIQICNIVLLSLLVAFYISSLLIGASVISPSHAAINNNRTRQIQGRYFNVYRTKDGKKNFVFRYVNVGWCYEIDIISQPSYGFRSEDPSVIHRLYSDRSDCRYVICVNSHAAPRTLEAAMRLSMDWAELTWYYIKTGVTIDKQLSRR